MALPYGKHVMLSYNWKSQNIVSNVHAILKAKNIPVWFDIEGGMKDNIYKSMAEGVENAEIVCCFMSPEYQESINCERELIYAQKQHKRILPCIITDQKGWEPSSWLGIITAGMLYIKFKDDSEEHIRLKTEEIINHIIRQPSSSVSQPTPEPTYLMELIKYEYMKKISIERIMNSAKSFPIEQSYINLSIVKTKEQNEKEKQLQINSQHNHNLLNSFEEIYGSKMTIDIKDIFEICKTQEKQVLVFGRAGIGKSTFCRYVAYQWAKGSFWSQYDLLALIPLRRLTINRYPLLQSGQNYSLIDVIKKEVFQFDLSEKDNQLLKKQFDLKKILWILDGYDEIIQNLPLHLEDLLHEKLLKTPHHILTSRPYLNTLSYNVQMEITGFTDDNIEKYVQQFFNQMKDDSDDVLVKSEKLLNFLKSNSSIWGVAHIPVNLELICSLWSNQGGLEIKQLTITKLYTMIIAWLCRRYLTSSNKQISILSENKIIQCCEKELSFLEILAFNAMESNTIIIRPSLLEKALDEAKISLQENPHILNIGILKSFHKEGTGTGIEMDKDHYFVHLSFQEYFAARYLVHALKEPSKEKAIEFIKYQKYNQRYALVFSFMSGLLSENDTKTYLDIFWDTILGPPVDFVGIRHMQLVIACLEESFDKSHVSRCSELLEWISQCLQHTFGGENNNIREHLLQSLQRAESVVANKIIMNTFINLLECNETNIKLQVLGYVPQLLSSNSSIALMTSVTNTLDDQDSFIRKAVCDALAKIGKKAATNEVISKLLSALEDESDFVRLSACSALGNIGEKAATNEVISKLVSALEDESDWVRSNARNALGKMSENVAMNEVISKLVSALEDESDDVRKGAWNALRSIGEKAATNEVISKLVSGLEDENDFVRESACSALGSMGEKAATNEVISKLVSGLEDESDNVRKGAWSALGSIGKKAATNEVISKLVSALEDESDTVRQGAWNALGEIGEKAATNEVISKLVTVLEDESDDVRKGALNALGNIGERAATNEVISKLVSVLEDESDDVRKGALNALGSIGEKAATNEVISKLVSVLEDENDDIRKGAWTALGIIGEKAATNEVISKLVSALEDDSDWVRSNACSALGSIGEKAATNEVINKLVSALEDESDDVRDCALEALKNMGEKAATDEVINKLVCLTMNIRDALNCNVIRAIGNIVSSSSTIEKLDPKMNTDIWLRTYQEDLLPKVSADQLINALFTTKNRHWLSAVSQLTLWKGAAVIFMEDRIVVYGNKEPVELPVVNLKLQKELIKVFTKQARRLHLSLELSSKAPESESRMFCSSSRCCNIL